MMDIQATINLAITGQDTTADGTSSVTQGLTIQETCDVSHQGVDAISGGTLTLPATQEPQQICLGGIEEACGLFVRVNGPATLLLNGQTVALALAPANGAAQAAMYFSGKVVSATLASDTTSQDVSAIYQVWGAEVSA